MFKNHKSRGSWEAASTWYKGIVAKKGHYYHEHVVLPGVLRLLGVSPTDRIVDLGCGSGVLERAVPKPCVYTGYDISQTLIQEAQKLRTNSEHVFVQADVTQPIQFGTLFSKGAIILALQNMPKPEVALMNLSAALEKNAKAILVLNHPCFRIPRQSSWGIDEKTKTQYRRIDRYLSPLEIPMTIHPGKQGSPVTWDYHFSLQDLVGMMMRAGFVIETLEEWISDKQSAGAAAKMENRARTEFPLFMAFVLRKV